MDPKALSPAYRWYRLRERSYDQIYVSPHMDDAVYSCGGQLALERAAGRRILVVTVFGNGNDAAVEQTRGRGVFADYAVRLREERAASERLDVDYLWLNYPDLLLRPRSLGDLLRYGLAFTELPPSALQERIYASLVALCARFLRPQGRLFFPLAVGGHPDHRLVFGVGSAFATRALQDCRFYEDIPYAQVAALRDQRLRQLGLQRPGGVLAAAREVNGFVFAHAPAWQRPLTLALLTGHTLATRALGRWAHQHRRVSESDLDERDISAAVDLKVAAMRAYQTQTTYFFLKGEAIYSALASPEQRYVERYWHLRPAATPSPLTGEAHIAEAQARAEALQLTT